MKLAETFTCEVCGDEVPCLGYERRRAPMGEMSSADYPNRLCLYCSRESKKEDAREDAA